MIIYVIKIYPCPLEVAIIAPDKHIYAEDKMW